MINEFKNLFFKFNLLINNSKIIHLWILNKNDILIINHKKIYKNLNYKINIKTSIEN